MENLVVSFAVLLAITIGIVEAVKRLGVPEKFAPVVSVVVGLALSALSYFLADTKALLAIVGGLVIGLSAVGLYSGVKNVAQGFKKPDSVPLDSVQ